MTGRAMSGSCKPSWSALSSWQPTVCCSRRCRRGAQESAAPLPPGAEAFTRDMPGAVVRFFDTGHFALETHVEEIAVAIRDFLAA